MARKRRKRRTKAGRLGNLIYDYKYLYNELFGDQDTPLNLVVGQKVKKIKSPIGKVRAFIRALNGLVDYTDEKNEASGRKLWELRVYDDLEYNLRNVKFRREMRHYAILEYIKRKYRGVTFTDNVLAVMSDRLNIPFYLLKNVYKSWKHYKHKMIAVPKKKTYMSDSKVESYLTEDDRRVIEELFGHLKKDQSR